MLRVVRGSVLNALMWRHQAGLARRRTPSYYPDIVIQANPAIFDRMTALADSTRSRVLLLLERHELTVNEIRSVLQLPQSTVSRHLKALSDQDWVTSRPDGTSRRYRTSERLEPSSRKMWNVVREQVASTPASAQDARRVQTVLAHRRSKSQKFFSSAAGQWDRLRTE